MNRRSFFQRLAAVMLAPFAARALPADGTFTGIPLTFDRVMADPATSSINRAAYINRATYAFWQRQDDTPHALSDEAMRRLFSECAKGSR